MLAIVAAIGGFLLLFSGHPGWGLIVEVLAIVLGNVGFFMSASPRVSGGILSIAAIVIAVFGMGFSLLGLLTFSVPGQLAPDSALRGF